MVLLKRLLIAAVAALALLLVVAYGGGALLDGHVALSTTRTLAWPPDVLFPSLETASGVAAWWQEAQLATDGKGDDKADRSEQGQGARMTVEHAGGPDRGPGMVLVFRGSDGERLETWTLKRSDPPTSVVYDVDFAGALTVERTFTLAPHGGGSDVTWAETGDIASPPMRWMKVLMPAEQVTKNFDLALGALEKATGK